jgi:tripartite-type tricarboxylate transporter receptor subunit TctC
MTAKAKFLVFLAGISFWSALPHSARAEFPDRPIRIIVPFAPGGAMDIMARDIASVLSKRVRQTVTVENVTGGGTVIGTQRVVSAPPDGYTLLFQSGALAINVTYRKEQSYDVRRDLAPITKAAWGPFAVLVSPSSPAKSLKEFIAYAKRNPGKLNYGSSGAGAGMHLIMEYLKATAGVDIVHVPFRGEMPATTALLSGDVQVILKPPFTSMPLINDGKVIPLAVTGLNRSKLLPNVPTIEESGYPTFLAGYWGGFLAPAKTPNDVIKKLNTELVASINDKYVTERLLKSGVEVVGNSPEEFKKELNDEIELWHKVIIDSKIPRQ